MKNQVLVKRYSLGLIHAAGDEAEYSALFRELDEFNRLLLSRPRLFSHFARPFLPTSRKKIMAREILKETGAADKLSRFILLLIENERLELLPEIVSALPDIWNEEKGIVTIEVISVIPLTEEQKSRLMQRLERLEGRPVILRYRNDPSLIGGLSLQKGNIVYDASIQGNLDKLQDHISEG